MQGTFLSRHTVGAKYCIAACPLRSKLRIPGHETGIFPADAAGLWGLSRAMQTAFCTILQTSLSWAMPRAYHRLVAVGKDPDRSDLVTGHGWMREDSHNSAVFP